MDEMRWPLTPFFSETAPGIGTTRVLPRVFLDRALNAAPRYEKIPDQAEGRDEHTAIVDADQPRGWRNCAH